MKHLANPSDRWLNEHESRLTELMDAYALVVFEDLAPKGMLPFSRTGLTAVGRALGKRHPHRETPLLTRANYRRIVAESDRFAALGVRVYVPPAWT